MNTKVIEKINKLKDDRVHGASWLSRQAIRTLNLAIKENQSLTITEFVEEIQKVAAELIKAGPNITPIANYTSQFLHQIMAMSQDEKDLDSLKKSARITGKDFLKSATKAVSKSIEYGCGIISDLDTVITCSYSSTVCQVLEMAKKREAKFRVMVTESRLNDQIYGQITARQLMKHQIPVELISDQNINLRIAKADKALVGADSITADGYLINGKPTFLLAQAAKKKKIPFYVVCESAKFDIQDYVTKSPELEPGFERTPLNLITGIITEKGTMQPSLVMAYIEQKTEEMARLSP